MSRISYGCTALVGTTKKGELKCDPDGYYDVVLGAFNFHNAGGAFYPLEPARELIEKSSPLTRRLAKGSLYAENGHPKMEPGMSMAAFIHRICRIEENNQCAHIREISLGGEVIDERSGAKGVLVMGRVKPSGPKGDQLAAKFENKHENVCFSIRSLTKDRRCPQTGKLIKSIQHIETWDHVTEPGISVADKWNCPSLEAMPQTSLSISSEDFAEALELAESGALGMESSGIAHLREVSKLFDMSKRASGLVIPRRSMGR